MFNNTEGPVRFANDCDGGQLIPLDNFVDFL